MTARSTTSSARTPGLSGGSDGAAGATVDDPEGTEGTEGTAGTEDGKFTVDTVDGSAPVPPNRAVEIPAEGPVDIGAPFPSGCAVEFAGVTADGTGDAGVRGGAPGVRTSLLDRPSSSATSSPRSSWNRTLRVSSSPLDRMAEVSITATQRAGSARLARNDATCSGRYEPGSPVRSNPGATAPASSSAGSKAGRSACSGTARSATSAPGHSQTSPSALAAPV
ncbi:hypothetical protein SAXI111661_20050 [Saccharomonospora xinjiangensis]